jgi:hypothetical protein
VDPYEIQSQGLDGTVEGARIDDEVEEERVSREVAGWETYEYGDAEKWVEMVDSVEGRRSKEIPRPRTFLLWRAGFLADSQTQVFLVRAESS